jgi:uncharacterized protein involved in exopolysaccharide biosynthesis
MDSSALTVPQLFSTLWRGRYLLAFLAISAALIGLYVTVSMPEKYKAEGLLVIEPREVIISELGVAQGSSQDLNRPFTEARVLQSRSLVDRLVNDLGLATHPALVGVSETEGGERETPGAIKAFFLSVKQMRWLRLSEQNFRRISGAPAGFRLPRSAEAG